MDHTSTASKTALMVAAYRARASRWEKPLFVDPWAEKIAGAEGEEIAKRLDAYREKQTQSVLDHADPRVA